MHILYLYNACHTQSECRKGEKQSPKWGKDDYFRISSCLIRLGVVEIGQATYFLGFCQPVELSIGMGSIPGVKYASELYVANATSS